MVSRLVQSDGTTSLAMYLLLPLLLMTLARPEAVAWGHAEPQIDEIQRSAADAGETFVCFALSYPQFPHPALFRVPSRLNLKAIQMPNA